MHEELKEEVYEVTFDSKRRAQIITTDITTPAEIWKKDEVADRIYIKASGRNMHDLSDYNPNVFIKSVILLKKRKEEKRL